MQNRLPSAVLRRSPFTPAVAFALDKRYIHVHDYSVLVLPPSTRAMLAAGDPQSRRVEKQ